MMRHLPLRRVRGLVLDVDGTLTCPHAIDFAALRARGGAPAGVDVLTHSAAQPAPARGALLAAVADEEARGLDRARVAPHAAELFAFLARARLPRALLTRNNEAVLHATVARVLRPHLPPAAEQAAADAEAEEVAAAGFFSVMLSRAFEPPKPHPAALQHVAERWSLAPADLAMAGDAEDDMLCARAAGALAVLVGTEASLGAEFGRALPHAHCVVDDLRGLRLLLEEARVAPEA